MGEPWSSGGLAPLSRCPDRQGRSAHALDANHVEQREQDELRSEISNRRRTRGSARTASKDGGDSGALFPRIVARRQRRGGAGAQDQPAWHPWIPHPSLSQHRVALGGPRADAMGSEWLARRSEERRVGKEWRSRWSPYH